MKGANSNPPAADWLNRAQSEGIRIFGAGGFARDVAKAARRKGITVHAFVTSAEPNEKQWQEIPIRRVDAAELATTSTWIGVFNRERHSDYSTIRQLLQQLSPGARLVWPQQFYGELEEYLGWRFWLHPLEGYASVAAQLYTTRGRLEDSASRTAFDGVVSFRRAETPDWSSPKPSEGMQYLPAWLRERIDAPLRVVDGGAYRGETLRELVSALTVEQAWTFEPEPANYVALVRDVKDLAVSATHVPAGLSDRCGTAFFSSGLGEAGTIDASGNSQVPLVTLDECLQGERVNFLKLDVEGHELAALQGARNTLLRQRPMLAIAGYHRWDDLWRIPEFIYNLGLNYRLRLGLHGHNSFDTVFYAY